MESLGLCVARVLRLFAPKIPNFVFACEDGTTSLFIRTPALTSVLWNAMSSTDGNAGARMISENQCGQAKVGQQSGNVCQSERDRTGGDLGIEPQGMQQGRDGQTKRAGRQQ